MPMLLTEQTKVLVVHRRLFENDLSRFFIGEVNAYENGIAKVAGYTWFRDPNTTNMSRKGDIRTKLISLSSGALIVYQLPDTVAISSTQFEVKQDGRLILTDRQFSMDLTEIEHFEARDAA